MNLIQIWLQILYLQRIEEIDFPGNVYGDVLGEIQSLDKADINPKCTKAGKFKSCPQDLECAKVGYGKTGMNYD